MYFVVPIFEVTNFGCPKKINIAQWPGLESTDRQTD
jgi:hypothetical protein